MIRAKLLSQGHWEGDAIQYTRDGTRLIVASRSALQCDARGVPLRVLTTNNEITARKQAESELRSLSERLSLATSVAKVGVWEWNQATNAFTWDATMFEIYGFSPTNPVPYEKWAAMVHPEDLPSVEAVLRKTIDEQSRGSADFRIILTDGSVKNVSAVEDVALDEHASVSRVIGVNVNVTERTKADEALRISQAQMAYSAHHDFLTGLPNRIVLNERVNHAIALAARHQKRVAVLFLDLNGFKHINDSLGHSTGDKLLQSVARRLPECIRTTDTVSRQGGDEFVVLLSEVNHPEDTVAAARRLMAAVAKLHSIDGQDLHVTTSIGVSIYPDDGLDAETLIRNADMAMYQTKEEGREGYQFFEPGMNVQAIERQSIGQDLRLALERQEFAVHYQAKVDLRTLKITGAEALIRWTHPVRGPVSPAKFIPVAEDCGLIVPIGKWVLREACQQASSWIGAGLPLCTMAVNISSVEFRDENLLEEILATLKDTGLDPHILELELTESVLMKQSVSTQLILTRLRALGVKIAVDDFGTGYSSLSYLRKFAVDALKIDQSFVRQLTNDSSETAIVAAIISMGRSLNLRVVAEGVETQEALAFLQAHECHEGQGYYLARPVSAPEFARLLETGLSPDRMNPPYLELCPNMAPAGNTR